MTEAYLQLTGVEKRFRSGSKWLRVLRHFDLSVQRGEFLAIMGRSGSGKTTLLNCIAGLDRIDGGSIRLDGEELTAMSDAGWDRVRQTEIGMVFQFNQLLPEFTALENVMLPGLLIHKDRAALENKARDLLDRMGMIDRADHRPAQLSGGEQQRAAIARALINDPKLVLADEPTGSLDLDSGMKVFDLLLGLQRELSLTCVAATHNPGLADMCDRMRRIDAVPEQDC